MVMNDPRRGFRIKGVKYESSKKALVSRAGLQALLSVLDGGPLGKELAECLPKAGSNRAYGSYQLGMLLIASLLSGHDCLDDIEEFRDDELILELFSDQLPTAKSLGNFLRRFSEKNIEALKQFITKMGYTLRDHVKRTYPSKGQSIPHFKIDGTIHEQHGREMEGCGWITKSEREKIYGYASQVVFDEIGFCYAGELLSADHPRGNSSQLLNQVLLPLKGHKINNPFEKVADVSGDSAYLTEDNIRTCIRHHSTFTISAPRTILWHEQLSHIDWINWEYTEAQIAKLKKRKKTPPECLLGRWHWSPGWSGGKLKFPVIIKKEWQEDSVMDQSCGSYHYHAVATNKDLSNRSYQSIIEDYRSRAEVENQIKEFKHNFDAKHLPCLKKSANEVYFLFILISQNLIRWAAVLDQPDKPHYAKKLRRKLINSPAQILTGSRQLVLRVRGKFLKEVERFIERWRSHSVTIPLLAFSTS